MADGSPRVFERQLLVFHARNIHMQVDAVHQRAGDAFLVPGDHGVAAGTGLRGVAVVAAGAGVLGPDQHEVGRKGNRARGARDGHLAREPFQRLAQDFQQTLAKFRQFVEEEHAAMGQGNFTRPRPGPAADQAGVADRMVRRAKRPCADERRVRGQQTGHGIDLGHLQRFIDAETRQNAGQGLGNEGFPGSWRAR